MDGKKGRHNAHYATKSPRLKVQTRAFASLLSGRLKVAHDDIFVILPMCGALIRLCACGGDMDGANIVAEHRGTAGGRVYRLAEHLHIAAVTAKSQLANGGDLLVERDAVESTNERAAKNCVWAVGGR